MTNFSDRELKDRKDVQARKTKLMAAYPQLVDGLNPDVYITMIYNRGDLSLDIMRPSLKQYLKCTERELVGRRFYNKPPHKRLQGIFFAEKIKDNAHWHGALILPEGQCPDQ